jgi:hypothetical protein
LSVLDPKNQVVNRRFYRSSSTEVEPVVYPDPETRPRNYSG